MVSNTPLDLREVFSRPWVGEATVRRPWWLRWVPFLPSGFAFRTEVTSDADGVVVRDTQTFPDGRIWAPVLGPVMALLRCSDQVRFEGDDSLIDTIEVRFLGIYVGTITMHLRRT